MMQHKQASHMISRPPKNFLRQWQWQWWPDRRQRKLSKILGSNYEEMSKESLLIGELSDGSSRGLTIVPKGSIAVYAGPEFRRFVIPMSYLAMPEFRDLMDKVAEEFGFEQERGLHFPCDEQEFEQILLRCGTPPNV